MATTAFIQETADALFGEKEFLPLSAFVRKLGVDRKTVVALIAQGLLDVYAYSPGTYRKALVSKTSFRRFLQRTSIRPTGGGRQ